MIKIKEFESRLEKISNKLTFRNGGDLEELLILIKEYQGHHTVMQRNLEFNWKLPYSTDAYPEFAGTLPNEDIVALDQLFWTMSIDYANEIIKWVKSCNLVADTDVAGRNGGWLIIKLLPSTELLEKIHENFWYIYGLVEDCYNSCDNDTLEEIDTELHELEVNISGCLIENIEELYIMLNNLHNKFNEVRECFYSDFRNNVIDKYKKDSEGLELAK